MARNKARSAVVCPTCNAPVGRACVHGTWRPPLGGNTTSKPHPARVAAMQGMRSMRTVLVDGKPAKILSQTTTTLTIERPPCPRAPLDSPSNTEEP